MEIIMSDEPYLVIDWTGASETDKEKALSGINAAFAAIGATAAHGRYGVVRLRRGRAQLHGGR